MAELPMQYETRYAWDGEAASGRLSIDRHGDLPVRTPHDPAHYSPEHLLVAAAEICLANYVLLIAGLSKLDIKAYRSTATGELEHEAKAGYRFKRPAGRIGADRLGHRAGRPGRVSGDAGLSARSRRGDTLHLGEKD